jgi:large subunit ribosomal protein L35Ae
MKATIINFRKGVHTQKDNQLVLEVEGISSKEDAAKLVGKAVVWKTPSGKEMKGKVSSPHGNKGAVRAIFEKGMPGQCISTKAEIL